MNAPSTFESFLLYDGEKKNVKEANTKVTNAAIFTANKEDHTFGNMIKNQLLKHPNVLFVGHKQPLLLEHKFELCIQTLFDYTLQDALTNAIMDIFSHVFIIFEKPFKNLFAKRILKC